MSDKAIDKPLVLEALRAIRAEAHRLEEGPGYPMVSVRSLAQTLGCEALIEDILQACVEGGFSYCLDHTIPATHWDDVEVTYPSRDVCHWGADQLRSRLDCVDYRVYAPRERF